MIVNSFEDPLHGESVLSGKMAGNGAHQYTSNGAHLKGALFPDKKRVTTRVGIHGNSQLLSDWCGRGKLPYHP
jgi:hypothetical protein